MANANLVVSIRCETEDEHEQLRQARDAASRALRIADEQAKRATHARFIALLVGSLLLAAVLSLPGCASMGGPRHVTAVSLAGTAGVLETFVHTEKQLVCGQPSAPQAPLCVTVPRHLQIMDMVERAAVLGSQASGVMASLPRGTPQPAQVVTMLAQVQGLITAAMALVPEGRDKAALAQAIGVGGTR